MYALFCIINLVYPKYGDPSIQQFKGGNSMKSTLKRLLGLALAAVMLFSAVPTQTLTVTAAASIGGRFQCH